MWIYSRILASNFLRVHQMLTSGGFGTVVHKLCDVVHNGYFFVYWKFKKLPQKCKMKRFRYENESLNKNVWKHCFMTTPELNHFYSLFHLLKSNNFFLSIIQNLINFSRKLFSHNNKNSLISFLQYVSANNSCCSQCDSTINCI